MITVTGTSSNELQLIAREGSESDQLLILNQDLPRDVLELLVEANRPAIAIALVSAQHDLPRDLVVQLEAAERERLRTGSSIGMAHRVGNMDHASTEFRLKMLLEDIKFERLRDVFDDLELSNEQREELSERKRSGRWDETVADAIAATAPRP